MAVLVCVAPRKEAARVRFGWLEAGLSPLYRSSVAIVLGQAGCRRRLNSNRVLVAASTAGSVAKMAALGVSNRFR